LVFFPLYLVIGLAFGAGWFIAPSITVVIFFVMSAWHFGREDETVNRGSASGLLAQQTVGHASAIAIGGLSIWIPAVTRSDEFYSLLIAIVPTNVGSPVAHIAETTRYFAYFFIPIASWFVVRKIGTAPTSLNTWVPVMTGAVAVGLPVLFSFSLYFCGWHSWRGLRRLQRDERLDTTEFLRNVFPLSTFAILGVVVGGCWLSSAPVSMTAQGHLAEVLQTLFIGLSAMAVPHLLLHEVYAWALCAKRKEVIV
jgi:Brp/Blh family beta-carotene 15,15'-monooxygenase